MRRRLILVIILDLVVLAFGLTLLNSWKSEQLRFGLVYHHPVGNWTHVSKIHWLGSPSQFAEVSPDLQEDLRKIAAAGYKSILFHVAIDCLNPYNPYPTDFDNLTLKQNVKWIADRASAYGVEVYVLYYPDWRCPPYSESCEGYYYDEDSPNWKLMVNFTDFLVKQCESVRWVAPFCLTDNMTAVQNFFDHLIISPKILIHADQPFVNDILSAFPKTAPYEAILNSRNRPKLLEVYDEPYLSRVQDLDEHIITGCPRQRELTQAMQIDEIKNVIATLGEQRNIIVWSYADYPDSSYPEDLGIVQTASEDLPSVEVWDEYTVQTYWLTVILLIIAAVVTVWIATKKTFLSFNGDVEEALKSILILLGFLFFVSLLSSMQLGHGLMGALNAFICLGILLGFVFSFGLM
ncbi:MAG: hypothetical protein NWF14_04435 [Candidatus Bathyarchaeota archaeon]|nr:hypothetical protein [Candidatus Bathyarchaeota archaeon]